MTIREDFRHQAQVCAALGSPFVAQLMQLLADRLTPGDLVSDALFNWPGDRSASGASVPLRLAGGLHMLVLCDKDPGLKSIYPPIYQAMKRFGLLFKTHCRNIPSSC